MKKLLVILVGCSFVFVHGAGCKSCLERRQEWLAKRPTLEEVFPELSAEVNAIDEVFAQHKKGELKKFLDCVHQNYLRLIKDQRYQQMLKGPKQKSCSRLHSSALDYFKNDFPKLKEARDTRDEKLYALYLEDPSHFLAPMLRFLGTFHLDEPELNEIENTSTDLEFYFKKYLLSHRMIRPRATAACYEKLKMMILELEMTQQMPVYELLPKLTKYIQYEKLLHIIAQETYKLPGCIENCVAQIQKGYMKERASCIRNRG